jgi:predicted CxxxxCH...CXXCH cytochrome family protein
MRDAHPVVTCCVALALSLAACGKKAIGPGGSGHEDGDNDKGPGGDVAGSDPIGADLTGPGDHGQGDGLLPSDTGSGDGFHGLTCSSCHGSAANYAPPIGLGGKTETTARGVGAHQSHLQASAWHKEIVCAECHLVPAAVGDVGHIDTPWPAELTWGTIANADTANSTWNGDTCDTYCHGETLLGGAHTLPVWTKVGENEAVCGNCHGLPPQGAHPQLADCHQCHAEVVAADNATFAAPGKHIDGIVQAAGYHPANWEQSTEHGATFNSGQPAACTGCHGSTLAGGAANVSCEPCHSGWKSRCVFCHGGQDNQTGAPPYGVDGETARTTMQVGAHSKHVADSATHLAYPCSLCHVMPTDIFSPAHLDDSGTATVTPGGLNAGTVFSSTTGVCSNNYCHGNGRNGVTGSADWNTPGPLACAACHNDGSNPQIMSGQHDKHIRGEGIPCVECHSSVVNGAMAIIDRSLHVDGARNILLLQGGTWSAAANGGRGLCDPTCHIAEGKGAQAWYP